MDKMYIVRFWYTPGSLMGKKYGVGPHETNIVFLTEEDAEKHAESIKTCWRNFSAPYVARTEVVVHV